MINVFNVNVLSFSDKYMFCLSKYKVSTYNTYVYTYNNNIPISIDDLNAYNRVTVYAAT